MASLQALAFAQRNPQLIQKGMGIMQDNPNLAASFYLVDHFLVLI